MSVTKSVLVWRKKVCVPAHMRVQEDERGGEEMDVSYEDFQMAAICQVLQKS